MMTRRSTTLTSKQSALPDHCHFPETSHLPHRYQVEYDEGLDNILIVDGVPVIDKSKLEMAATTTA